MEQETPIEPKDVLTLLKELPNWGGGDRVQAVADSSDGGARELRFRIFTATHCYNITAKSYGRGRGFLRCGTTSTKWPPGEDWHNDVYDGPLTRETFEKIIRDILGYELLPLMPMHEPVPLPGHHLWDRLFG
jgi:hypothetical protein